VDVRYRKQVHELTIPVAASGRIDDASLMAVVDDFVRTYERLYGAGSSIGKAGLELAMLRVEGIARIPRSHDVPRFQKESPSPVLAFLGRRKVWWKQFGGFRDTDAFQLEKLACGNVVEGPAIIEAYGTSIPLHPGQRAFVDEWLNLVIEFSPGPAAAQPKSADAAHPKPEAVGADA
jgi:N-methylhydantoinase A